METLFASPRDLGKFSNMAKAQRRSRPASRESVIDLHNLSSSNPHPGGGQPIEGAPAGGADRDPIRLDSDPIRVLVGDPHTLIREGLGRILESEGFSVCAEAADSAGAVDAALKEVPDICLLDVEMPGGGITAAARITERLPDTLVVMFTESESPTHLVAALRAGASGYLPKDTPAKSMANALKAVTRGEAGLPRHLVSLLIEELRAPGRRPLQTVAGPAVKLTPREWDTLELLDKDLSAAQIAERLQISRVTARRHIANVVRKLNVTDRGAAVRAYRQNTPA